MSAPACPHCHGSGTVRARPVYPQPDDWGHHDWGDVPCACHDLDAYFAGIDAAKWAAEAAKTTTTGADQ